MTPDEWHAEADRIENGIRAVFARRGWDLTPGYDPDDDEDEEEDAA